MSSIWNNAKCYQTYSVGSILFTQLSNIQNALIEQDDVFAFKLLVSLAAYYNYYSIVPINISLEVMRKLDFAYDTIFSAIKLIEHSVMSAKKKFILIPVLIEKILLLIHYNEFNYYNSSNHYLTSHPTLASSLNVYTGIYLFINIVRRNNSKLSVEFESVMEQFNCLNNSEGILDTIMSIQIKIFKNSNNIAAIKSLILNDFIHNTKDINSHIRLIDFYIENKNNSFFDSVDLMDTLNSLAKIVPSNHYTIILSQLLTKNSKTKYNKYIIKLCFKFLDYPSNSPIQIAWHLLHRSLSYLSTNKRKCIIQSEWSHRRSWWVPLYFNDKITENNEIICKTLAYYYLCEENCEALNHIKFIMSECNLNSFKDSICHSCYSELYSLDIPFSKAKINKSTLPYPAYNFTTDLIDDEDCEETILDKIVYTKKTKFFHQEDLAYYITISNPSIISND